MLDADTVEWFKSNGGLTRVNGDTFRRKLLSVGGAKDSMDAFRDLRGREPDIAPLLRRRGLDRPEPADSSRNGGRLVTAGPLAGYPHLASGKVRNIYLVDDDLLLFVATDRISAYDHVLPTEIPDKGRVLTAMSVFWFDLLADVIGNHLVSVDDPRIPDAVLGRAMLVRRLDMLPVECVARGYLTGSGLVDYRATGAVCGIALPTGLVESVAAARADLHPGAQGRAGRARREHQLRRGCRCRRRRARRRAARAPRWRCTAGPPSTPRPAG